MVDFINLIDRVATWRGLAIITIPVLLLSTVAKLDISLIISLGFFGVIASVLSLRGQEGDV